MMTTGSRDFLTPLWPRVLGHQGWLQLEVDLCQPCGWYRSVCWSSILTLVANETLEGRATASPGPIWGLCWMLLPGKAPRKQPKCARDRPLEYTIRLSLARG